VVTTTEIIKQVDNREVLTREQLVHMLSVPPESEESLLMMAAARRLSKAVSGNRAEIHAQLALNLAPCPANCQFCSFAMVNGIFHEESQLSVEEAVEQAQFLEGGGTNAIYVMTTATYPLEQFLEVSAEIRRSLKPETVMIANVGDKAGPAAESVREAGYGGVYHAIRLREGVDTTLDPKKRLRTIQQFQDAGLVVGTCVEPVGPEHSNEEIAEMILLTAGFTQAFSGAARRIAIPGTKMARLGMISELRMSQIVAVTRLAMPWTVTGNCAHEPCTLGTMAGANLLWAEVGANPRDIVRRTEENRGVDCAGCANLFAETEWQVLQGPSKFFGAGRMADCLIGQ
jgi:biotin synthase